MGSSKTPLDLGSSTRGSTKQTSPEQQISQPRPGKPIRGPPSIEPSFGDPDSSFSSCGLAALSPVTSPSPLACSLVESFSPSGPCAPSSQASDDLDVGPSLAENYSSNERFLPQNYAPAPVPQRSAGQKTPLVMLQDYDCNSICST